VELTDQEVAEFIAKLKKNYPKKTYGGAQVGTDPNPLATALASALDGNYNSKLQTFYSDYERYLYELAEFEDKKRRTFKLELRLSNAGRCPATNLHVFLHFPDGIAIYDEDSYEKTFVEPTEPEAPVEGYNAGIAGVANALSFSMPQLPTIPSPFANVTGWVVKRSNSVDLSSQVKELTHGLEVGLDSFYVMFESRESVRSFQIDYELLAGNIPEKLLGKLHVIVEQA
jgi:hypothetical protein